MRIRFAYDPSRPAQLHGIQFLPMLFDIIGQQQAAAQQAADVARQDAEIARLAQVDAAERARIDAEAKAAIGEAQKEVAAVNDNLKQSDRMAQMAYHNRQRMNRALEECLATNKKLRMVVQQLQAVKK